MSTKRLSRRDFLKAVGVTAGSGAFVAALSACGGQQVAQAPQPTEAQKAEAKPTEAPKEAAGRAYFDFDKMVNKDEWGRLPTDHKKGTLISQADWYKLLGDPPTEPIVMVGFNGGWGTKWVDIMLEQLKKEHPGLEVKTDFDPRIWEKMKPSLVAGEVPDWMYATLGGWGGQWMQGVTDGLVAPGDFLLDLEAYGFSGQRVEEIMFPGSLKAANGGLTDHQWTFPMSQYMLGIYYNTDLFEANNWPSPDTITWEEFMDLQKQIAEKIKPWTYAGKYPGYMDNVMSPLMYKKAGQQAYCDLDNLVAGAFNNPDLAWGIEQVQTIFKNDWIYQGSEAMTHTESQQIFVDGKCAMIPNGSWLENEQRETTPQGFRMSYSGVPAPKDGKGFKNAIYASIGSADLQIGNGKHPLWGMEIMRIFYSPAVAKLWAGDIGTPIPIKDAMQGAKASDALQSALDRLVKADGHYGAISHYGQWYPTISKPWSDNMGDILWGKIAPNDILAQLERAADEVRKDATIEKHELTECTDVLSQ
ncbi:MAG: twin-arginine translocation signal domain-containing protein [Chloroflexi bacterium]|nr:twin-arginine translocation signal domain-containing protein [Chloroflexota bacterium]